MSTPATSFDPTRRLDLYFRIKRVGSKKFVFTNAAGTAIDISGYSFALYVKEFAGARTNIISLTVGSGLTVGGSGSNELTASFTVANTNIAEAEYYWELYKGSTSKTYLAGKAFAHNGLFDGVDEDTNAITITDETDTVTITLSDGMTSAQIVSALAYTPDNVKGVTASGTDTYTATYVPAPTAYATGQRFTIIFTNANTGAATLNLNGLGAKDIKKGVSTALSSGDIAAGEAVELVYDGTNFQIIGDGSGAGTVTASNGLTKTGDDIALGGTITGATTLTLPSNTDSAIKYQWTGVNSNDTYFWKIDTREPTQGPTITFGRTFNAPPPTGEPVLLKMTEQPTLSTDFDDLTVITKKYHDDNSVVSGSGMTRSGSALDLGGTTSSDTTLEPTTLNTQNVQIGTYNNKAYNNVFTASERVHIYINPHGTSASSNDHFVVYGGSGLVELLSVDKAAAMRIRSRGAEIFIDDSDGTLKHYLTINPSTHTMSARMEAGVSDFAEYTHDNNGFDFNVDGNSKIAITVAGAALTGTPTAPTAAQGTNTTQIATTAFVQTEIAADAVPIARTIAGLPLSSNITATELNDALETRRVLYKNTTASSVTGTTDETILGSVQVAGGTLLAGDILRIVVTATKSGTAGAFTIRVSANSTAALGGEQIAAVTPGAATQWTKIEREVIFNTASSQTSFGATVNVTGDVTSSNNSHSTLTTNYASAQFFIVSIDLVNAGDTGTIQGWYLEIIRGS